MKYLVKEELRRCFNNTCVLLKEEHETVKKLKQIAQKNLQGDLRNSAIELIRRFNKIYDIYPIEIPEQKLKKYTRDTLIEKNEDIENAVDYVREFNKIMTDICMNAGIEG